MSSVEGGISPVWTLSKTELNQKTLCKFMPDNATTGKIMPECLVSTSPRQDMNYKFAEE